MWRRQTQAQWEVEQQEREVAYRKELEQQLQQEKEKVTGDSQRTELTKKQKQLSEIMVRCTAEAKNLEKLKMDLQRAQEDAVTLYTTKTNEL